MEPTARAERVPLALVRHGQTDWNLARRVQGHTDIALNDTGREQAREAAALLGDGAWDRVVTSTLGRAEETGRIIADTLGLSAPDTVAALVERGYGEAEGLTVDEYRALAARGDVPGLEHWRDVAARAGDALVALTGADPRPTIVVAHGGVIRSLLHLATGGRLPRAGERVDNGSVTRFDVVDGRLELDEAATSWLSPLPRR